MKFISVGDLRDKSDDMWRELIEEREMVITRNGRPIAILAAVNDSSLEETLSEFRRARALSAAGDVQRRSVARRLDSLTADEIDVEIAAVRETRARGERRASIDRAIEQAREIGEGMGTFDATASIRADRNRDGLRRVPKASPGPDR